MDTQDQIRYVKIIPDPPEPTLLDIYLYDPLDYVVWKFFQLSLGLLLFAIITDLFSG